jgi:hypothetical protein
MRRISRFWDRFVALCGETSAVTGGFFLRIARAARHGFLTLEHMVQPVTYQKDPRVDAYIDALPGWQQKICQQVRDLVHAADPGVTETIKRRVQPYFVLDGNICALLAAKDHVNVFLYDGGIVPDPEGIITGGHNNATGRTVAIRENEKINTRALGEMFAKIIANNRAGGWRKIKQQQGGHA